MSFTSDELIMLASVATSLIVGLGMFAMWRMSIHFEARCDCALYYGLYLMLVNIPRLLLTIFHADMHSIAFSLVDILGLVLIFLAAETWAGGSFSKYHWAILVPGIAGSVYHHYAWDVRGQILYAATVALILVLTLFYIAQGSPWWAFSTVAISFVCWMAMNFAFPHSGDPVGHAFGMVTKVLVFGAIMLAYYEREHRELFEAAALRKLAIQAVSGDADQVERVINGTGPTAGTGRHTEVGGLDRGEGVSGETCGGHVRQDHGADRGSERNTIRAWNLYPSR